MKLKTERAYSRLQERVQEEMTSLRRSEVERSSLVRRIWAWTCLRWVIEVAEERAHKTAWWRRRVVGVAGFGFGFGGSAKAVRDMVVEGRWKGLGVETWNKWREIPLKKTD